MKEIKKKPSPTLFDTVNFLFDNKFLLEKWINIMNNRCAIFVKIREGTITTFDFFCNVFFFRAQCVSS